MCCFSQEVRSVSETKIFARVAENRQFLAYQMRLDAPVEVAMVLPLPVDRENAKPIKFINLSDYERFFADLERCFPTRSFSAQPEGAASAAGTLEVVRVGSFDASFVPMIADFDRLDPRFGLPSSVWEKLPQYRDYSFAVFKFRSGEQEVHPMAFSFATREPAKAFFPTVHVHDGKVHPTAEFDHTLYLQADFQPYRWSEGSMEVSAVMDLRNVLKGDRTRGIIHPDQRVFKQRMEGDLTNDDVWIFRGQREFPR